MNRQLQRKLWLHIQFLANFRTGFQGFIYSNPLERKLWIQSIIYSGYRATMEADTDLKMSEIPFLFTTLVKLSNEYNLKY